LAQVSMFPPQSNSPVTELAADISSTDTTVMVVAGNLLPAAPNVATIGLDELAETIYYATKNGNELSGVIRGYDGTSPKGWNAGTRIARYLTAQDISALQHNVSDHETRINGISTATINKIEPRLVDDLPALYPIGLSLFSLTLEASAPWKTAIGHSGSGQTTLVQTAKANDDQYSIVQRVTFSTASGIEAMYERSSTVNNSWNGAWIKVVSRSEFDQLSTDVSAHLADVVKKGDLVVNVKDYGAVLDGITDDTMSLQNAINDGTEVYIPSGVLKVTSPIVLKSNLKLRLGAGAVIDATDLPSGSYLFNAIGSLSNNLLLTSDAASGSTMLSLDSSTLLPDDIIFITSDNQRDPSQPKDGEFAFVKTVSSGSVGLYDAINDTYTMAKSAKVQKMVPISNITITGGKIKGGGTGKNQNLGLFRYCKDVWVSDITIEDFETRGIEISSSIAVNISGINVYRSNREGLGYGVVFTEGASWCSVVGSKFFNNRHAVSGGGLSSKYGRNRHIIIDANTSYGTIDAGIDSHSNGVDWIITNNKVSCMVGSNAEGIIWQGSDVTISNNIINNVQYNGIRVQIIQVGVTNSVVITGNRVNNSSLVGIYIQVFVSGATLRSLIVANNIVTGAANNGIYIVTWSAETLLNNFVISGNTVVDVATGIMVRAQAGNIRGGTITGNRISNVASGQHGISMRADADMIIDEVSITGNSIKTANTAIAIQKTGTGTLMNCWVDGNLCLGGSVSGFATGDVGSNRSISG